MEALDYASELFYGLFLVFIAAIYFFVVVFYFFTIPQILMAS